MRQFSQPLRTGTKVPRLHPVTGCRGHPCPRRCGTHGGCRIKLKRDNRCHHNLRQCSHDFLIDSCRHTHIATPELQPIRELARRQLHACLSSRTALSARSRSRVRRPLDGRDRRESKNIKKPSDRNFRTMFVCSFAALVRIVGVWEHVAERGTLTGRLAHTNRKM